MNTQTSLRALLCAVIFPHSPSWPRFWRLSASRRRISTAFESAGQTPLSNAASILMSKSRKSSTNVVSLVTAKRTRSAFEIKTLFIYFFSHQKSLRRTWSVKPGWWSSGSGWLRRGMQCWYPHLEVASLELLQTGKKSKTLYSLFLSPV